MDDMTTNGMSQIRGARTRRTPRRLGLCAAALVAAGFAGARPAAADVTVKLHEAAVEANGASPAEVFSLIPTAPPPASAVGESLLINSLLRLRGPNGPVVASMHAHCKHIGTPGIDLAKPPVGNTGPRNLLSLCTQSLNVPGRGQLILTGVIDATAFEGDYQNNCGSGGVSTTPGKAPVAQTLVVTGGSGAFLGVVGTVKLLPVYQPNPFTQDEDDCFQPGPVKELTVSLSRPLL